MVEGFSGVGDASRPPAFTRIAGGEAGAGDAGRARSALIARSLDRSLAHLYGVHEDEIHRITEATYAHMAETDSVDPKVRDIIRLSGVSTQSFYRHFKSKDELLLVLFDDGRQRLAEYLEHRMSSADDAVGQIREWIEGILLQAVDEAAAARTRPFVVNIDRLALAFPAEMQESVDVLVGLLEQAILELEPSRAREEARDDALAIYRLTISAMHDHIRDRSVPSEGEIEHVVQFTLKALGATKRPSAGA